MIILQDYLRSIVLQAVCVHASALFRIHSSYTLDLQTAISETSQVYTSVGRSALYAGNSNSLFSTSRSLFQAVSVSAATESNDPIVFSSLATADCSLVYWDWL
jgi:hypothetical protein